MIERMPERGVAQSLVQEVDEVDEDRVGGDNQPTWLTGSLSARGL